MNIVTRLLAGVRVSQRDGDLLPLLTTLRRHGSLAGKPRFHAFLKTNLMLIYPKTFLLPK